MAFAPAELTRDAPADASIVGRHEQSFFGVRFVTHAYWFRPVARRQR